MKKEHFEFNKRQTIIKLFELGESFMARSRARQLLSGLEKFQKVVLDFQNVKIIGPSFADEIFRVWQKDHPEIKIVYKNCNEEVEFMIKRVPSE